MKKPKQYKTDLTPRPRIIIEKIGDKEWNLEEMFLDVNDDVRLWEANPRLQTQAVFNQVSSEEELEAALQRMPGYDVLRTSIRELGQMESIYVWRADPRRKFTVIEGASRVAILRDLSRKPKAESFKRVRAKILPPEFGERDRVILLARIHVRGSGVRSWGRYIEAKFIHDNVIGVNGHKPVMTMTEMAAYMAKSLSWVTRLKDAYDFARKFVEEVDSDDAEQIAAKQFSTLEEISKASGIGPHLRDYNNSEHDKLRSEVFDMVKRGVFKEYRDARFIKEFHDDPDKWEQLKSGEEDVAHQLALEIKTSGNSLKNKLAGLPDQVGRALEKEGHGLGDDEVELLYKAAGVLETHVHTGLRAFRVQLARITKTLDAASRADVKELSTDEKEAFEAAAAYFTNLWQSHGQKKASA
jgi:hypothetical protein